jgi:hypothetical protein
MQDPISKITRAKWAGGMAQMVKHLLVSMKPRIQTPVLQKKKSKKGWGTWHKW